MPAYPFRNSFAKYLLKRQGITLMANDVSLFDKPDLPTESILPDYFFNAAKQEPYITTGTYDKPEYTIKVGYDELVESFGYVVIRLDAKKKYLKYQKYFYKLAKKGTREGLILTKYPPAHYVEYDIPNERLVIRGMYSDGKWVVTKKNVRNDDLKNIEVNLKFKVALGLEDADKFKIINKKVMIDNNLIPIGFSPENKLVCLPKRADAHIIGFVGPTGTSKSISMHSLSSFLYWQWDADICVLNDWNNENDTWALPSEGADFVYKLNQLNLVPSPLPCVYLRPYWSNANENDLPLFNEGLSTFISLDWEKFLSRYQDFTEGYDSLELGKSKKYINMEALSSFKSYEQIDEYFKFNSPSKESYFKLSNIFRVLLDNKLLSISCDAPSKFNVLSQYSGDTSPKVYSPTMACMHAKLIPIFSPREIENVQIGDGKKRGNFIPAYMNYLIQDIYTTKENDDYFKFRYIYLVMDELAAILSSGANKPIIELASRGRMKGVGMLWATQLYTDIIKELKTNTQYLFCFGYDDSTQIGAIASNYNCPKRIKDELHSLGKKVKHECYVFHSKPIYTYDLDSGELVREETRPIRMQFLPPLSKHKKPMEVI